VSEWDETRLGDVVRITIGKTPPRNEVRYWTDDLTHPFCTIADMETRAVDPQREGVTAAAIAEGKAKVFPAGSLMMSFKLSIGRVGFAARDICPNEAIARFQTTENDLNEEFLALALEGQDLTGGAGRAVKGNTLNGESLRAIRVSYPSLAEQHRIVDVMAAVDAQIEALTKEARSGEATYSNATSLLWLNEDGVEATAHPLGDVMVLDVQRRRLDVAATYRSAGVLNAGKGLIDKGSFLGSQTEYSTMNVLRTGQVVMRKLTAWEGPIAVVPREFDDFVASNEFPTFRLNDVASPAWMKHVCRTPRLWDEMKNRVTGTVQRRKRLNPDQLLEVSLPIPSREVQECVADALGALDQEVTNLTDELRHLRSFRSALLTALLSQRIEIPESYDRLLEPTTAGAH
jgi:type I restriction enzyme S subunit